MFQNKHLHLLRHIARVLGMVSVTTCCIAVSFFAGVYTVGNVRHDFAVAQPQSVTRINVLLQYVSVSGETRPIEVSPILNGSQTPLVHLLEIHSGLEVASECKTTSSTGRCSISNVPVAGNPEKQYDIVVNESLLEYITSIPFEQNAVAILFDQSKCGGSGNIFNNAAGWCLTKKNGLTYDEYFVTLTLRERDVCIDTNPPAPLCDAQGRMVQFRCNQSYSGPTKPFEPMIDVCGPVSCPDGIAASGLCSEAIPGVPSCNNFASCAGHQRCTVVNVAQLLPYTAGTDIIIIRGSHFGADGGTVRFPTYGGGSETVTVYPGPNWKDGEIRARIPVSAVSGVLSIHPATHGTTDAGPVMCDTPSVTIRGFFDQFALLDVTASSPEGIGLVSPGFDTVFSIAVRHNERVSRLDSIDIQLLQGAYADPALVPLDRVIVARELCDVNPVNAAAREDIVACTFPVPASAAAYPGPYTYVLRLFDDTGQSQSAVLLDSGSSAMAGDLNADRRLTIADAVLAMRVVRGIMVASPEMLLRDPNQDGAITTSDVLTILHSLENL